MSSCALRDEDDDVEEVDEADVKKRGRPPKKDKK
jgi:hypothetical protein